MNKCLQEESSLSKLMQLRAFIGMDQSENCLLSHTTECGRIEVASSSCHPWCSAPFLFT